MQKNSTKIEVKTFGGNTLVADDSVKEGQGTNAYIAFQAKRDIFVQNGSEIKVAPYHAIDFATITTSAVTVTDPDDAFCEE